MLDRSSLAVARAVRSHDAQLADLLEAQGSGDVVRAKALLAEAEPQQRRYRGQFTLIGSRIFGDYVTVLEDFLWVYDDDIVGLIDGGVAPAKAPDPWAYNTLAVERFAEMWPQEVFSIRLCLFEGIERTAAMLRERDAIDRVTHLELRRQNEKKPTTIELPSLFGLACMPEDLPVLLAGAPFVESLVVYANGAWPSVDVPDTVRHLGIYSATPTAQQLETLVRDHPKLESLEFFYVNESNKFPFDALSCAKHLEIALAGHLVRDDVRVRFPEVTFVSYDRRERMAHDFATIGFGAGAR